MVAPTQKMSTPDIAPTVSDLSDAFDCLDISNTINARLTNLETIHEDTEDVLKYKHGWIRDGRQLLISGEGLLITETNIADIFDNFEYPDHAKRFARLIWALLSSGACLFPSEAILDKIREVWTGDKDKRQRVPRTPILLRVEVYAYFGINWQPTRKLIFVAATKDSIPELFKRTKYAQDEVDKFEIPQHQPTERQFLAKLRDRRTPTLASDNLEQAINRWHRWLEFDHDGNLWWERVSVPSCDKVFQEIFRMYQVGRKEPSESFLKIWHSSQPTVLLEPVDQEWLIVGDTDKRDWDHIAMRNRAPQLCVFVFEDLGDLGTSKIARILAYYKEKGRKGVSYDYTVLRGRYFSGSTHFDDNRPWLESISRRGVISNRRARLFPPNPYILLKRWIWGLENGETYDASTDSDREDYHTDDSDRRRYHRKSKSKGSSSDSVQGKQGVERNADEVTATESSDYAEEEEDRSSSEDGEKSREGSD
jgi:hypothetical protein